ncbi:hypothetical protein [Duganella sp. P38]|uniref:hypothetical protein n=1 Tax=Duganella sp. P38 TaxID=3423949 RepID=UPI003D7B67A5
MKRFAALLLLAASFIAGASAQTTTTPTDAVVPEFKRGINLSRVFGFPCAWAPLTPTR